MYSLSAKAIASAKPSTRQGTLEYHTEILNAEGNLRKIPVSSILKSEIKGIFAELTVNIERSFNKLAPKMPIRENKAKENKACDTNTELEKKMQTIVAECDCLRKTLNASKQNVLTAISEIFDSNVQAEVQKFVELTDSFDKISAKQHGINRKLMHLLSKSKTEHANKPSIEIEIAPLREDSPMKSSDDREELYENNSKPSKDKDVLSLNLQLSLEKDKSQGLLKTVNDLKQVLKIKEDENSSLQAHLNEYINISEEQYAQLNSLKKEFDITVRAVKDFLKAMDFLSKAVTENNADRVALAKEEFDNKREEVLDIISNLSNVPSH